jgi:hypothetical protein
MPSSLLFPILALIAIGWLADRYRLAKALRIRQSASQPLIASSDERDNWEIKGEVTGEFLVRALLHIHYVDGAGLATERTVEIKRCGQYLDDVMMHGYCRLREAPRSFLVSRIKRCFDEETGEVVTDVSGYLNARYEQSPEYSLDQWFQREHDILRILLYVAKADGYLRAKEREAIVQYGRVMCGDDRITEGMIADLLSRIETPSIHVFKRLVGTLQHEATEKRNQIIRLVEQLISTDNKTHPAELEALAYLRERWHG